MIVNLRGLKSEVRFLVWLFLCCIFFTSRLSILGAESTKFAQAKGMKELNVPQKMIDEVIAVVSTTRDDVLCKGEAKAS